MQIYRSAYIGMSECNRDAKSPLDLTKEVWVPTSVRAPSTRIPSLASTAIHCLYREEGYCKCNLLSRKVNGRWESPVEITSTIEAGEDCSTCSLNGDGTELFLYKNDGYDGNFFPQPSLTEGGIP